jgi:hypothetical protein
MQIFNLQPTIHETHPRNGDKSSEKIAHVVRLARKTIQSDAIFDEPEETAPRRILLVSKIK